MSRPIKGVARVGERTKELVNHIKPGDIACITHQDLDEVAAFSLFKAKVSAVINSRSFTSGRYPNSGPLFLLERGVLLFEVAPEADLAAWNGQEVVIYPETNVICWGEENLALVPYSWENVQLDQAKVRKNLNVELKKFVQNTLEYAAKELGLITGEYPIPEITTKITGRHVLVVVRGKNYRADLAALRSYISEIMPVLIGVDGGADALLELGWKPDIIIGDMDSVSDEALASGAELIIHGYMDGRAPGAERLAKLGLEGVIWQIPGTSEDLALLLAYEQGADLIVAVGTHSNMVDFLDKGRPGMASTFLVRLKVGEKLVDAKGVYELYKGRIRSSYVIPMLIAAAVPVMVLLTTAKPLRTWFRLLVMYLQVYLGF